MGTQKAFVLCIIGRTCTGKDTLARALIEHTNLDMLVSYTTRPKRNSETDGVEHYFITEEEYLDNYVTKPKLAYTEINGYRYFTLEESIKPGKKYIYIIDPNGYLNSFVSKSHSFDYMSIYLRANFFERRRRYLDREHSYGEDKIQEFYQRHKAEHEQFGYFEQLIHKQLNPYYIKKTFCHMIIDTTNVKSTSQMFIDTIFGLS